MQAQPNGVLSRSSRIVPGKSAQPRLIWAAARGAICGESAKGSWVPRCSGSGWWKFHIFCSNFGQNFKSSRCFKDLFVEGCWFFSYFRWCQLCWKIIRLIDRKLAMEEDWMTRCKGQHVQCEDLGMFWWCGLHWMLSATAWSIRVCRGTWLMTAMVFGPWSKARWVWKCVECCLHAWKMEFRVCAHGICTVLLSRKWEFAHSFEDRAWSILKLLRSEASLRRSRRASRRNQAQAGPTIATDLEDAFFFLCLSCTRALPLQVGCFSTNKLSSSHF